MYVRTLVRSLRWLSVFAARVALVQAQRERSCVESTRPVELRGSTQLRCCSESARLEGRCGDGMLCAEVNRAKPGLAEEIGRRLERRANELTPN